MLCQKLDPTALEAVYGQRVDLAEEAVAERQQVNSGESLCASFITYWSHFVKSRPNP